VEREFTISEDLTGHRSPELWPSLAGKSGGWRQGESGVVEEQTLCERADVGYYWMEYGAGEF
jgi:hypothetical protein